MEKLKIIKKDKYDYTLEGNNGKIYTLNIEFYGLEEDPKINDYIYMSDKILKEKNLFSFGIINNNNINIKEEDLIKIVSDNKEYYLQRYYG